MSEERDINTPSGETRKLTAEDIAQLKSEFKAKQVTILNRSQVQEHLYVELPPDVYGEWIPKDAASIAEAQAKGFQIDTEYAPSQKSHMHSDGLNRSTLGDCVFMTMPRWKKEAHEEIARERFIRTHGKRKGNQVKEQQEEASFMAEAGHKEISKFEESEASTVTLTPKS